MEAIVSYPAKSLESLSYKEIKLKAIELKLPFIGKKKEELVKSILEYFEEPVKTKETLVIKKSQLITNMYDNQNLTISEIAKKLGIRYQHAYNVISNHMSKSRGIK